jgi:hypothetical protein
MSAAPGPVEPATMSAAQCTARDGAPGASAHAGAPVVQEPWVALTKGECLLLALALRRLARADARSTSPDQECQP